MNQTERESILVVDDDAKWLETIEDILGNQYDLKLTPDSDVALALVQSTFFSLVILDQRLSPGRSGLDLLSRLRKIRPELRAIILTGYAELEDAVESMQTGALDYISKGKHDLPGELQTRVAKALAANPRKQLIAELLQKGESADLEFKGSARWDIRENKANRALEAVIVKTICAFLNSDRGGVLLVGVDDKGTAIGLENDYKTLKKQDRDGYETFLTTLLLDAFGNDISPHIRIDFQDVGGHDVCRVCTMPSPRPVFVSDGAGGEHLYIRTGNSSRQLNTREALEYCRIRW